MSPQITPVWAAALALLFVILSARTLLLRRKLGIALGDSGNETLHRAIRVHANFAEYVPLTLLLAVLLELGGARALLVHAVCCPIAPGPYRARLWGEQNERELRLSRRRHGVDSHRGRRGERDAASRPVGPALTDESILARVAAGDKGVVAECLDRYGALVWSLVRARIRNAADAEDAAQEIFVDLWKSAARYDSRVASEAVFIATIARRRVLDRLRAVRRRPLTEQIDEQLPLASAV